MFRFSFEMMRHVINCFTHHFHHPFASLPVTAKDWHYRFHGNQCCAKVLWQKQEVNSEGSLPSQQQTHQICSATGQRCICVPHELNKEEEDSTTACKFSSQTWVNTNRGWNKYTITHLQDGWTEEPTEKSTVQQVMTCESREDGRRKFLQEMAIRK